MHESWKSVPLLHGWQNVGTAESSSKTTDEVVETCLAAKAAAGL